MGTQPQYAGGHKATPLRGHTPHLALFSRQTIAPLWQTNSQLTHSHTPSESTQLHLFSGHSGRFYGHIVTPIWWSHSHTSQPHLFNGDTATPQWAHSHTFSVGTQSHILSGHTATYSHILSGRTATHSQWAHSHTFSVGTQPLKFSVDMQPHILSGHKATLSCSEITTKQNTNKNKRDIGVQNRA